MDYMYKVGDLVVDRTAPYRSGLKICRVDEIEYVDENHEMYMPDFDDKPYTLLITELVYHVPFKKDMNELNDIICYESWEVMSLEEYLNTDITIDDYIDFNYNRKSVYPDDEEDM